MQIDSILIEWCNHTTKRPKLEVILKDNWPRLDRFKFIRYNVTDRRVAYKGTCGPYCEFFMQDLDFKNNVYDKPLEFDMGDGVVGFGVDPWRWHAAEMNEFFNEPAMDVYFTTPEFVMSHRSVTLAGAYELCAAADCDLALIYTRTFGGQKTITTLEPIRKTAPDVGNEGNVSWEKIK